jgi:hypothetical protein
MAEESAKLRIPYLAAAQAQKHVTHNEAMTLLDTLVQLSVLDKDLSAPPSGPDEGDCYIVAGVQDGGTATGAWEGWETRVARYIDGTWRSYLPGEGAGAGWLAWVLDEDAMYRFDGEAWALAGIEGPAGQDGADGEDGEPGASIAPNAVVNEIAGRDAYDDEAAAFAVLVVSDSSNDNKPTLYYKLSATSADWSDPVPWPEGSTSRPAAAFIIDGGFELWPVTTDDTGVTTTRKYVPHMFAVRTGAGTLGHVRRSTGIRSGAQVRYALELVGAGSVTDVDVDQRIEAASIPLIKRTVTFSAWLYNDTGGAFSPTLLVSTPSAADNWGSSTVRNGSGSGDALQSCADGAWTQIIWSADISGYTDIDNGVEFRLRIPSGSLDNSAKSVKIGEVQLDRGLVAAPEFQGLPPQQVLALAQRYFYSLGGESATERFGVGFTYATTGARMFLSHPVPMRTAPSVSYSAAGDFELETRSAAPAATAVNTFGQTTRSFVTDFTTSGLTAGEAAYLRIKNGTTAGRIRVDARL